MSVSLSIKDVPDKVARALRRRARANQRSMQGELLVILKDAVQPRPFRLEALMRALARHPLSTPSESVQMIRETRDSR